MERSEKLVAEACYNVILAFGLSEEQKMVVLGLLSSSLVSDYMSTVVADSPATATRVSALERGVTREKTQEDIQPASKPHGKPLAEPGGVCSCDKCRKGAYRVKGVVYSEGMTGESFADCFEPPLPLPINIFTDDKMDTRVDCPHCQGDKTVVIIKRSGDGRTV